jgi:hypothetical protein
METGARDCPIAYKVNNRWGPLQPQYVVRYSLITAYHTTPYQIGNHDPLHTWKDPLVPAEFRNKLKDY